MLTTQSLAGLVPYSIPKRVQAIKALMTPAHLLKGPPYRQPRRPRPIMILPDQIPTYDALLARRSEVQNLHLLPVKDERSRKYYKEMDQLQLTKRLYEGLQGARMGISLNSFPYFLPPDVIQHIVWVRDPNISQLQIAKFISRICMLWKLSADRIVMFERPATARDALVKGTFPHMRHVHFWHD